MNAKALLYIGLPLALLAMLYVALRPTPEIAKVAPPAPALAPAPAPAPAPALGAAPSPVPAPSSEPAPTPSSAPAASQAPVAAAEPPAAQAPAAQPADAKPLVFALVARNNKLVSGPAVIKVQKDDEVTITITSDKADKLHLHGYDLHADLVPGKTATLKFKANLTGRFTYELHRADVELGALEVFPR